MDFAAPNAPFQQANPFNRVYGSVANAFSNVGSELTGAVVAFVIIMLLILCVVGYVVYRYMLQDFQSKVIVSTPVHCKTGSRTMSATLMPTLSNGKEYTLSFWMYVEDASPDTHHKNILTFGKTFDSAAMLVFVDKTINKMVFKLRTTKAASASATAETAPGDGFLTVPVEYVPLQRWIHFMLVVDQDIVSLYLDGDPYSVSSVSQFVDSGTLVDPDKNDIVIGSPSTGVDGFVSNLRFFNHALSVYEASTVYRTGPVDRGLLGAVGLPRYRLRWPITTTVG